MALVTALGLTILIILLAVIPTLVICRDVARGHSDVGYVDTEE